MKNFQIIILCIIILSGSLTSCNHEGQYYPALLVLEKSLNNAPEAVVDSLKKMDAIHLSGKEKALYYMLLARGLELSGEVPKNDSILSYSFAYYSKHDDNTRLAQLYYLQGEIYRKGNYLIRATESYRQADKYAKDTKWLQFRLNTEMSHIYRYKIMEEEEDSCLRKVLSLAVELKDSSLLSEAFHNLSLSHINRKNYEEGKQFLNQAISLLPIEKLGIISDYYKEMSQIHLSMQCPDSALYYINQSISKNNTDESIANYNLLKGDIFLRKHQLDSAEYYFMQDVDRLSLSQKVEVYHKMYCLKKKAKLYSQANRYMENHLIYRDSLDLNRKEGSIERMNHIQAYKRQRAKADEIERELSKNTLTFYRVAVAGILIIFSLLAVSFRIKLRKRNLEKQLQNEKLNAMEVYASQQETEMQLLKEREEREKIEIEKLNQTINYYKSLNAITIPVLMKKKKGTMLHLTEEEWEMVVRNTDACFDGFTARLRQLYSQLSEDEIHFCCLVKMELSISLLARIYHIADGSISRKKMRLKEKMEIENMSLDEFIQAF